ncbi:MAG: hypothetical protein IPM54_04730 [Polyangiaceae bacterium]|nr:hypothetical protein [Polyangiaceae bacterium]
MTVTKPSNAKYLSLLGALASLALGCGDGSGTTDAGNVQIFVEAEDTIPNGLSAGMGEENILDGWNVKYSRFVIAIGNFRASRSDATDKLTAPGVYVLDLMNVPAGGYIVHTWNGVEATRWDRFGFDLPNAGADAKALEPTTDADKALLVDNKASVYIEGEIDNGTTKKTFKWALPAGTSFDDCADENGLAGFAVPAGGSVAIKPTIHGDHWFFNSVTAGVELTERYAQYIADSDLDMDGETTIAELQAVKDADLAKAFPADKYNLSGVVIESAYDYVLAQARTLGDFQGEGECPTRGELP